MSADMTEWLNRLTWLPEPDRQHALDLACPHCQAEPGQFCERGGVHWPRWVAIKEARRLAAQAAARRP